MTLPFSARFGKLGLAAGILLLGATAVFGTVNHNDVHRVDGTVFGGRFIKASPGMMYVALGNRSGGSPVCWYAGARQSERIDAQPLQRYLYYNTLGWNLPIAELFGQVFERYADHFMVSLTREWVPQALPTGFSRRIDPECETNAELARRLGSVVCVVDTVYVSPKSKNVVAIRFERYGLVDRQSATAPECPLAEPEDIIWTIKRPLIAVMPDPI
jgi:hypothetical protein